MYLRLKLQWHYKLFLKLKLKYLSVLFFIIFMTFSEFNDTNGLEHGGKRERHWILNHTGPQSYIQTLSYPYIFSTK